MTEEQAAQIIEELPEDMTLTEALEYIHEEYIRYLAEDDTEPTEEPTQ